jgi:AraC family transcriptional regulator of adaptative response / DNA-3-methyladenine glycosylase II
VVTRAAPKTRSPDDVRYEALLSRDARYDGVFFVAVTTTGIYCRPICPVRTPMRSRVLFFETAAQAERAGFRACFRCRPELAPGSAGVSVDAIDSLVAAATHRIREGALNETSLDELAQSRRLALAKQLLQDTLLPATDIAFAAGFGSVRRFNAVFAARMGRPPSEVRRIAAKTGGPMIAGSPTLRLDYREPYAWPLLSSAISPTGASFTSPGTLAKFSSSRRERRRRDGRGRHFSSPRRHRCCRY